MWWVGFQENNICLHSTPLLSSRCLCVVHSTRTCQSKTLIRCHLRTSGFEHCHPPRGERGAELAAGRSDVDGLHARLVRIGVDNLYRW